MHLAGPGRLDQQPKRLAMGHDAENNSSPTQAGDKNQDSLNPNSFVGYKIFHIKE